MTAAGLLAAGVPAVVGGPFYYISIPVFAFPPIQIVFLIVKLVTRGAAIASEPAKNVLAPGLLAADVPIAVGGPFLSYI